MGLYAQTVARSEVRVFGLLRNANVMEDIPRWAASVGTISAGLMLAARVRPRIIGLRRAASQTSHTKEPRGSGAQTADKPPDITAGGQIHGTSQIQVANKAESKPLIFQSF
jgi:hypothetical protein